jgi:hypothetical protein
MTKTQYLFDVNSRATYNELNHKTLFTLHARNTVTGETRDLVLYSTDAQAAYARGFVVLDTESGDRSWCFDGYEAAAPGDR